MSKSDIAELLAKAAGRAATSLFVSPSFVASFITTFANSFTLSLFISFPSCRLRGGKSAPGCYCLYFAACGL